MARTLRNALTARPPRVAHAYLFTGPRGIGKTTNARLMAKCLNCEQGPTPVPCNKCDFCLAVTNGDPTMDLVEIDAASNTQVDKVREVIVEKLNRRPTKENGKRIFIIDEVHMLSTSSFNALLKTLEEPPPYVVFILATTEYQKVPQTITSRCQRFDFRRVGPSDIVKRLQYVAESEGIGLDEDAAHLIARHAEGALRDALTLLEQVAAFSPDRIALADVRMVLGGVPQELINALVEGVAAGDAHAVLQSTDLAVEEGASFFQLAKDLTSYLRDLMLMSVGFAGDVTLSPAERTLRQRHAQSLGRGRVEAILGALREAAKEMRENVDHRLILELTLVRASEANFGIPASAVPGAPNLRVVGQAGPAAAPAPSPSRPRAPAAAPVNTWRQDPSRSMERTADETFSENSAPAYAAVVDDSDAPLPPEADAVYEDSPTPASQPSGQPAMVVAPPEPEPDYAASGDYVPEERVEEVPADAAPKPKRQGRRIHNFEDLTELWPAVLQRVRKKVGITAVAYLHDAYPVAFNEEEVVLEFKKEFHHAKATEASGRLPFEQVISETFDRPRRLRLQLAVPPKPVAEVPEEPVADDDDDDPLSVNILDYTQQVFGAEIMGRSGG